MARSPGSAAALRAITDVFGDRPFRVAEALASGVTTRMLRSCTTATQVVRIRPSVVVTYAALAAAAENAEAYHLLQLRAAIATLGRPGWASVESAALVHDVPRRLGAAVPRTISIDVPGLPDRVEAALPAPAGFPAFSPVHLHGTGLADCERTSVGGISVTSLCRTAVELARGRPLRLALVPVDAVLRRLVLQAAPPHRDPRAVVGRRQDLVEIARESLSDVAARMRGWPGIVAAREAIALADARAESPLESSSRGHLLERSIPPAQLGAPVLGDDGRTYYGDFVWQAEQVIGECDGWSKYLLGSDPQERLRREKWREDALRRAGWIIVRWTSDELQHAPAMVVARVLRALAEGRSRGRPGTKGSDVTHHAVVYPTKSANRRPPSE